MAYYGRKASQHVIDERFEGRSLEVYTVDGDKLVGLVDEVSRHEIGMIIEGKPVVVERSSILYVITGLSDIHGAGSACERDYVLDESFVGYDVTVRLINGSEISGRLLKISRDEIGIAQENRALIVPRRSIVFIRIERK